MRSGRAKTENKLYKKWIVVCNDCDYNHGPSEFYIIAAHSSAHQKSTGHKTTLKLSRDKYGKNM